PQCGLHREFSGGRHRPGRRTLRPVHEHSRRLRRRLDHRSRTWVRPNCARHHAGERVMHQRNRVGDLAQGMAAFAALVGLVVGVPVALVRLAGSPLPANLPRWSEVVHALGQSRVADSTLIKGAALICWAAWAVLVACVLAELAAWVLGRTVARLPVVGPFQLWAARLVASALLVFSSVAGMVRPA